MPDPGDKGLDSFDEMSMYLHDRYSHPIKEVQLLNECPCVLEGRQKVNSVRTEFGSGRDGGFWLSG